MSQQHWNNSINNINWRKPTTEVESRRRNNPRCSVNFKEALLGQPSGTNCEEAWPRLRDSNRVTRGKVVQDLVEKNTPDVGKSVQGEDFPALDQPRNDCRRLRIRPQGVANEDTSKKLPFDLNCNKSPPKKPQKKDPINVNVLEAIQLAVLRKQMKKKEKKIKEKIMRRLNCGNLLDSDRPVMRRGKVRLKKKNLSRIKQAILAGRLARKSKQRHLETASGQPLTASSQPDPVLSDLLSNVVKNLTREFYRVKCIRVPQRGDKSEIVSATTHDDATSRSEEDTESMAVVKNYIHSRKFRTYCVNMPTKDLLESVKTLVISLREYQDRVYKNEPLKFKMKRRYVCGFKETIKYLRFGELKLVIAATNLEIDQDEPMNEMIQNIVETAKSCGVPCAFAGTSYDLGYWTAKKGRISIIGVLNFMGAEEAFRHVTVCLDEAISLYNEKIATVKRKCGFTSPKDNEKKVEDMIQATMLMKLTASDEANTDHNQEEKFEAMVQATELMKISFDENIAGQNKAIKIENENE